MVLGRESLWGARKPPADAPRAEPKVRIRLIKDCTISVPEVIHSHGKHGHEYTLPASAAQQVVAAGQAVIIDPVQREMMTPASQAPSAGAPSPVRRTFLHPKQG